MQNVSSIFSDLYKLSMLSSSKTAADPDVISLIDKYKIKIDKTQTVIPFGPVYKDISDKGIRPFHDERLKDSCKEMPKYSTIMTPSSISLTPEQFKRFLIATRPFLMTIFKDKLVIPNFSLFETEMSFLHETLRYDESGKQYEAVPHLKKLDKNLWQSCSCSVDGQFHGSNLDNLKQFPLMGLSKLFLYALAIDMLGYDAVHANIGLHTTRKSLFEKEIVPQTSRTFRKPVNPATECGAIVLCSLLYNVALKELSLSSKYDYVYSFIKEMAGNSQIGSDKAIFMSLMDNDSEYKSLCYYLESCKAFRWPHDINKDLEFYFQICSFEANIESLSIIGAAIANNGINPFTNKRVIKEGHCRFIYNYMLLFSTGSNSAHWVRKINLPVVFGESGCCLFILPGIMAHSFISPKLNEFGFSSRSYKFIKSLCDLYYINPYEISKHVEVQQKICPYSCSMFRVVGEGDFFGISSYIRTGMRPCVKDTFDQTVLHYAAASGIMKCVEFILRLCPSLILKKDMLGNTASKAARLFGHDKIADFLETKEEEKKISNNTLASKVLSSSSSKPK